VGDATLEGLGAQALAAHAPGRVRRLVLLSTDHGGPDAVAADPEAWRALTARDGTPREQATRLLGLLFPAEFAALVDAADLLAATGAPAWSAPVAEPIKPPPVEHADAADDPDTRAAKALGLIAA
jgi:pimeloyl-ACP methyl ester carboxylesterase